MNKKIIEKINKIQRDKKNKFKLRQAVFHHSLKELNKNYQIFKKKNYKKLTNQTFHTSLNYHKFKI